MSCLKDSAISWNKEKGPFLFSLSPPFPQCWPTTSLCDIFPYDSRVECSSFLFWTWVDGNLFLSSPPSCFVCFQFFSWSLLGLCTVFMLVLTLTSLPFVFCFSPIWQSKWMTAASVLKLRRWKLVVGFNLQLLPHLHWVLSVFFLFSRFF